jgi:hypothetical protein
MERRRHGQWGVIGALAPPTSSTLGVIHSVLSTPLRATNELHQGHPNKFGEPEQFNFPPIAPHSVTAIRHRQLCFRRTRRWRPFGRFSGDRTPRAVGIVYIHNRSEAVFPPTSGDPHERSTRRSRSAAECWAPAKKMLHKGRRITERARLPTDLGFLANNFADAKAPRKQVM